MENTRARSSEPLVAAPDVGVHRGERWLIRHVDLEVHRGALIYLIGANGAGKSTFARALLGLVEIDEGTIERAPAVEMGYAPAATVRRFSSNPEQMAVGAAAAGVVAVAGGRFASAEFDTPSGPSIVVAALALFALARVRGRSRA